MRLYLLSLLLLHCLSANAQFRDLQWGASKEETIISEGIDCLNPEKGTHCRETSIWKWDKLADAFTTVNFYFADGKLTEGKYVIKDNPNSHYRGGIIGQNDERREWLKDRYKVLADLLTTKYGPPSVDYQCDGLDEPLWHLPKVHEPPKLEYSAVPFASAKWLTSSTEIKLNLERNYGDESGMVFLNLTYESNELGDWGRQWREQKRLAEEKARRLKGL
jgi:hypothetical protein